MLVSMKTILDSNATLKTLIEIIQSLSVETKYQLLEVIEQQIFEAEEENYVALQYSVC